MGEDGLPPFLRDLAILLVALGVTTVGGFKANPKLSDDTREKIETLAGLIIHFIVDTRELSIEDLEGEMACAVAFVERYTFDHIRLADSDL